MGAAFLRRRDLIVSLLREMPNVEVNVPEGAFYVFPDMSHYFGKKTTTGKEITGANELALYLLNEGHVSTVSGEAFGAPNNIRISFAASDENIIEAMKRVASKLTELS